MHNHQEVFMKTTPPILISHCGMIMVLCALVLSQCQPARPSLQAYRKDNRQYTDENRLRSDLIAYSREYLGCRYKKAGKDKSGFDCSGFVAYVYREFDIPMASSAHEQAAKGDSISTELAEKGDLIFFSNQKRIVHVGIITSNKKDQLMVIHSTSSKGVIEENILKSDYWLRRMNRINHLNSYLKSNVLSAK